MDAWIIGTVANAILAASYLAIALSVLLPVLRSRQWRTNPLASATGLIFLSCGAARLVRVVEAASGVDSSGALRAVLGDWRVTIFDVVAAAIALWYISLRQTAPVATRGAALFEDSRVRRRQALEIHDNIVQGLVQAKLQLELGEQTAGIATLERTLEASRGLITELVDHPDAQVSLGPGDLRREAPAGTPT